MTDKPVDLPALDGHGRPYDTDALLVGLCDGCRSRNLALEKHDQMRCTYCGGAVLWQWCRAKLNFEPEAGADPEYLGWDRGKNPAAKRDREGD